MLWCGHSSLRRWLLLLALGFALFVLQDEALAEASSPSGIDDAPEDDGSGGPTEIAKQNYRLGVAAFGEGRFQDAITAFLVADGLAPSAALSFNIARAFDELQKPEESLYWYGDYLRRSPDAGDREQVLLLMAERERSLARDGVQLLVVLSEPLAASVAIGDEDVGTTPWHGVLPPGEHSVLLELDEYESVTRVVELQPEASLVLDLRLQPVTSAAVHAPAESPLEEEPTKPIPPGVPADSGPESASDGGFGVWPWVALGAGAASLAGALGFELLRSGAETDAASANVQLEAADAIERMDQHQTTARVMLGVGVVFTALGGTLLYLEESDTSRASKAGDSTATLIPSIGPEGFDVSLRHPF